MQLADYVVLTQETIRAVSRKHSLKALFLPKIHPMQAGNGLHLHLSFNDLKSEENAFSSCRGLSDRGQSFLEGILDHLSGLLGLTMPTHNSFLRMAPGCWTGSKAEWAVEDKEASLRVCTSLVSQAWERVEYKLNDGTANLYLSLAGILTCGLDGIKKAKELRSSKSDNKARHIEGGELPESIEDSLDRLEVDELLMSLMGPTLGKSYLALRRAEAKRASSMSLADEVEEALARA